jgi:hypothetical protein
VLLDDGNHNEPTYENIIDAYKTIVSQSKKGDCIFLHYSGELNYLLNFGAQRLRSSRSH